MHFSDFPTHAGSLQGEEQIFTPPPSQKKDTLQKAYAHFWCDLIKNSAYDFYMKYKSIVVLTGAGISAESGIKTFRDNDGLWENHRLEDVATPEAFERDPHLVHRFYNARRAQLLEDHIKPNMAHIRLAELEQKFLGDFLLITQNVDNLHERAGSQNILHMHGELLKARDLRTGEILDCDYNLSVSSHPHLRPHIVWFGEMPFYMDQIYDKLENCDLFISIGTSGLVYPAAGFSQIAYQATKIELNLNDTPTSPTFDIHLRGLATEAMDQLFSEIF